VALDIESIRVTGTRQKQAWDARDLPPVELVRSGLWSLPIPIPDSPLRYVLVYVVELRDGVALVDTGWPDEAAWTALNDGLNRTGHTVADVTAVLITHSHADHHGLTARVREASGAWIGMHREEAIHIAQVPRGAELANRQAAWLRARGIDGAEADDVARRISTWASSIETVLPDRYVDDGDMPLGEAGRLRAAWTPGHTPGHLCFADVTRGVMLTGDHVLPRITPNISANPFSSGDPLRSYLDSLARLELQQAEEVLPAHEYRFSGLGARVRALMTHHETRLGEMLGVVRAHPGTTTLHVASRLHWSRSWDETIGPVRHAAVGETFAHLVHLEAMGRMTNRGVSRDAWYVR
jgi:glyoxylase-like metal-dependent hydrolase (beta-lactamase superfamily II)